MQAPIRYLLGGSLNLFGQISRLDKCYEIHTEKALMGRSVSQ
jgi:hypothetical protein